MVQKSDERWDLYRFAMKGTQREEMEKIKKGFSSAVVSAIINVRGERTANCSELCVRKVKK